MTPSGSTTSISILRRMPRTDKWSRKGSKTYRPLRLRPRSELKDGEDSVMNSIGVIGSGTMGSGIGQVAARAGLSVVMHDVSDEFLSRGISTIQKGLQRDVEKHRVSAEEKQ